MSYKRHLVASLLCVAFLFVLVERVTIVSADNFDWSTISETSDSAADADNGAPSSNQKQSGNGFIRALGAPFRAISRLFSGGKKNDKQAKRTTEKDAEKFESAKVTRIRDASIEPVESSGPAPEGFASASQFDLHLEKGRELLVAGNLDAAISELSTAASLKPKSSVVNNLLGIAYEGKGLRERALQSFKVAVQTEENNPEYLNNLGFLLFKNGDYEGATKYLKKAAKLSPSDARIWNNLALTQCQRGKFEDAYTSFVRAVGEFSAHLNLAGQLQARGYAKDAIKHLEIAQALNPNSVDVLTKLVSLYELTGRPTDAETTRRSLVALKTFADAKK